MIVARMRLRGEPVDWIAGVRRWRELGVTHLAVDTLGTGLEESEGHIERIEAFESAIADAGLE